MLPVRTIGIVLLLGLGQWMTVGPHAAEAQTVHDEGTWLALFASGDLQTAQAPDDRMKWWFDGHARFFDNSDGFGQSIVRPGLGYRVGETATVWAGYGWIRTSPGGGEDFDEHRVWQQLTWDDRLACVPLSFRSRFEQRFVETGSDTGWRIRQLVAFREPIGASPRATWVAWDEIFFHLNDTDWGTNGGFDQNRVFLGIGLKHHADSPVRVEVGYLNQTVNRTSPTDLSNHLLSVNLFWNP